MRARALAAALAAVALCACASTGGGSGAAVQLVETWPVETDLDHRGIPDTQEVWLEMIGGAERSLDFAQFYASNEPGTRLEAVVQAVEAAIERGVVVRFLGSANFVETYPDTLARLERAGAEVRTVDYGELTGGVLHAKFFVVDDREAFLGSQNFDWRALEHIQELGVRVRDAAVARQLTSVFEQDWTAAGGAAAERSPAPATAAPAAGIQLVASPVDRMPAGVPWDLPRIVERIDSAEDRVWVQLLSYKSTDREGEPWRELEAALLRAVERGADVRLMLSHWQQAGSRIRGLQRLQQFDGLEVRLVTIPQASTGFIPFARTVHAKYLVVDDDRAWIGTSNWSRDYFYESRNVGLLIDGERVVGPLAEFFRSTWRSPYAATVDPNGIYPEPRVAE